MSVYIEVPAIAAGTWRPGVVNEAALPATGNAQFDARISLDDESLWFWDGAAWVEITGGGGGGGVDAMGAFGSVPNNNGGSISGTTLTLQPADATHPGGMTTGTQTIAGAKTLTGTLTLASGSISSSAWSTGSSSLTVNGVAFSAKAPSASPTFTGTVTLPSGSVTSSAWDTGTSTLTVNSVAFSAKAPSASPTFTGTVTLPSGSVTASAWDTGTSTLTSNGVAFTAKAPAASPTFTGTVTLPSGSVTSSAWDTGTSTFTSNSVAFTAKAPLASPTFTGTVTLPDASAWTSGGLNVPDLKPITFASQTNVAIYHDTANTLAGALAISYAGATGYVVFARDKNLTSNSTLDFIVGHAYTGINRIVRYYAGNNAIDFGVAGVNTGGVAAPRRIYGGTSFVGPRGSVSAATHSFFNDANDITDLDGNTGTYSPGTDQVAFTAGGVQIINCTSTAAQFPLGLTVKTGSNTTCGTATLSSVTVTVSTTAVKTGAIIILSLNTPGGTLGISYAAPVASITNATSFVINSVSAAGVVVTTDTSTINWHVINTF